MTIKSLLFFISLATLFFLLLQARPETFPPYTLLAATIYIFSHGLRALRQWMALSNVRFRLGDSLMTQLMSSSLSFATFIALGEFFKILLYRLYYKLDAKEMLFTIIFIRGFDLFFLAALGSLFIGGKQLFLISLFCLFILTFLLLFKKMSYLISVYLLKYQHTPLALKLVKNISQITSTFNRVNLVRPEKLFIFLTLTLCIWCCELLAVQIYFFAPQFNLSDSFKAIIGNIFHASTENFFLVKNFYTTMFCIVSFLHLVLFCAKFLAKKEAQKVFAS